MDITSDTFDYEISVDDHTCQIKQRPYRTDIECCCKHEELLLFSAVLSAVLTDHASGNVYRSGEETHIPMGSWSEDEIVWRDVEINR